MALVLGLDEAGRGPVIGSMFISGFQTGLPSAELSSVGVKDSKKLSDKQRRSLYDDLQEIGEPKTIEVTAQELDARMKNSTINEIELEAFADIIGGTNCSKAYVDLPEPDENAFVSKVKQKISGETPEIVAEHGADDRYDVVSAASIIAKTKREEHVKRLHKKYGRDFKSGYPHEEETIEFMKSYCSEKGSLPPEARKSWSTSKRVVSEAEQLSLEGFNT